MALHANFLPRRHGRYTRTRLEEMLRCFPGLSQYSRRQLSGQIFRHLRSRAFVGRLSNGADLSIMNIVALILSGAGSRFTYVGLGYDAQLESFDDWYARYVFPNTTLRSCTDHFAEQKLPCLSLCGITTIVFLFLTIFQCSNNHKRMMTMKT